MNTKVNTLCFLLFFLFTNVTFAQFNDILAVNDSLCVQLGEDIDFNVLDNDILPPGADFFVTLEGDSPCFFLFEDGTLHFADTDEPCCGDHIVKYRILGCQGQAECSGTVFITVKCPKPDCFLVDLEEYIGQTDPVGQEVGGPCVYTCENSESTYFINYNPLNTYSWSADGGAIIPGANPAEVSVSWGDMGVGTITLTITDANNNTTTIEVCVEILEGPVADFSVLASCVCLNAPMNFTNNSIGGVDYFWDFGDGHNSTMFEPTHEYENPGTYTVTLFVTNNNFDPGGNPLCCCTDSTSMEVEIDPLEGPEIHCVSTLCAQDDAKYWTNATNCGTYNWTVLDENDVPMTFDGQGTPEICVQWGNGPFGTVMLDVTGCDNNYCTKPTAVVVPIIPSTVNIDGPTDLCEYETETYTVPKWLSVYYDWQVVGGTIISGQGTNTVVIHWGPAGTGIITLNYYSDFLSGLPDHEAPDCSGTATLTVNIKPEFLVFEPFPNPTCVNSVSNIFASSFPYGNYTWAISPSASFTGQGSNNIIVTWDNGPGVYEVTAMPNDASYYCNDMVSVFITVVEVPAPDGIDGEIEICPGETYTYFGLNSDPTLGFLWNVTGGNITSYTGDPLTVTWNNSGPYGLQLEQFQSTPLYCVSDPIFLTITPKTIVQPLTITGTDACINEINAYSGGPAQHPDATYNWTITPVSLGSVISGQGTSNIQVQWNNDPGTATLTYTVELCGNIVSQSLPVALSAPPVPVITQIGDLCPGQSATLDGGAGYVSYNWSTSATTQTIVITSGGTYVLTVIDANGCEITVNYQAIELSGPTAQISTPDVTTLCIIPPNSNTVNIAAQTQVGYTFQWYCNGTPQALSPTQATFVHTNTNVVASFNYWVVVTDANGCMNTSNTITVNQVDECPGNNPCNIPPQFYTFSYLGTNGLPECNEVQFNVTSSPNVTLNFWNFGDPDNNINSGTLSNAAHTYNKAGYYLTSLSATLVTPFGTCNLLETQSVCIPIAADFSYYENCQSVDFTDLSTFLPGHDITTWLWDFGDSNSSTAQHPTHVYASPGVYTVILTVANAVGCKVSISQTITVVGTLNPTITAAPNPVWVGDPVSFTGTGINIISWLWDFDDGATNGSQNPSHTYTSPGSYDVDLTVVNEDGCTATATITVDVFPGIPSGTIAYTSLTICEGENTALTAPSGAGYSYLWSTFETTQTIFVGTAGTYDVTITDINNCSLVLDPVEVIVIPKPDATITGDAFICDNGCITLSGPTGFGFTYQWLDQTNIAIPFQTSQDLIVCDYNLLPSYFLVVTDANGCSSISDPFIVQLAVSPAFSVSVAPDGCEGTLNTLTIAPVQPDVVYSWSNGASGTSIAVIQAGTYSAVGTDTITGCSGVASAVIHPLPDLCLVPVGCYEICNPDTICGPKGLAAYQWNLDGIAIPGATDECLIVTASGTYSLTGVTDFGCTETSDSLILEVIDCGCQGLDVTATSLDSCCWDISYTNTFSSDLYGLMIHSGDADLDFDIGNLDPSLSIYTIGTNWVGLVNSTPSNPLPTGALNDFVTVCLSNVQNAPSEVIFDWYDFDLEIVCSDTLELDCPVEPDCLYMQSDSIYCEDGQVIYNMTLCNPNDNDFDIGFVQIVPTSPVGIIVSPTDFDLSGSPIQPGDCQNFTVILSGANIANTNFCYRLIGHEFNPIEVDTALCCSIDMVYCIPIPDCDPCDDIGIEGYMAEEDCCYNLYLYNNFDPAYFDGIGICVLSPNTTMTIDNPFGSGWTTSSYSPTFIDLDVAPPLGTTIPTGVFQLPKICLDTDEAPVQLIEIKWMVGDEIVCRDTIELQCEPDCAYILDEIVDCNSDGSWNYNGSIKNTSGFVMEEGHLVFTSPAGMSIYDQAITLGSLVPGGTTPFNFNIGPPAVTGDTVCFTLALHEIEHDEFHTNCCNIQHCFVLEDCGDPAIDIIETMATLKPGAFPNPSGGKFEVELPFAEEENVHFQLFDINNKLIKQWETAEVIKGQRIPVDIRTHPKGVYILVAKTDRDQWVHRVVVQ
jgi:PKD repeat protein